MENSIYKDLFSNVIVPGLEIGSYEALWDQTENMSFAKIAKIFSDGGKLILQNNFENQNLTWPKKFEKVGAVRVKDFNDLWSHLKL